MLTNRLGPNTSFQATPQQDLCLTSVSRFLPNKSILSGHTPALGTPLANNQPSGRKQKLSLWFGSQHQPTMLKPITAPQSDVYQARYSLLASINVCLKLGSGFHLPVVSGLIGSPSWSLNKETLMWLHWNWFLGGLLGVHERFLAQQVQLHVQECLSMLITLHKTLLQMDQRSQHKTRYTELTRRKRVK